MADHLTPSKPTDALDELTEQLLACGGPLSQIVGQMIKTQASGRSAPNAAPFPAVAHTVIRDAISALAERHQDHELKAAADIVSEATNEICENVFLVPLDGASAPGLNRNGRRAHAKARRRRA
jgi:hypothetical protein